MRALLSTVVGPAESLALAEVADPVCGPDQVIIDVRACAINYPDVLLIEDRYQMRPPRPFSPGGEVAGVISQVGRNVTDLMVGTRVIGAVGWGGMAERVVTTPDKCTSIPDYMPFDEAAAFLTTYGTSYYALKQRSALKPGERLLVLGAAGGVGLAAVQLGVALGAEVVAAASTNEKVDLAKAHGASAGVVYAPSVVEPKDCKTLAQAFKDVTTPGADVVYDSVGGAYCEAALRSVRWNGRLLVVGFPAGIPAPPLNLALLKGAAIVGVFYGAFVAAEPEAARQNIVELFGLYAEGKIRPFISQKFSLAEGAAALRCLAERQATGKVVVVVD